MTRQPKPLAGDLIARKDKPESEVAAEPPPAPKKITQQGEPMNFRVKRDFKRLFKSTAAQHGLKMSDLLVEAFELWLRENGR
jgi:hypothetical protein